MRGRVVPSTVFRTRVRDESLGGENPFRWRDVSSDEVFSGRRVLVFAVPGAFTPVCSVEECPSYDRHYDELRGLGVDEVYCLSVNDAFVMYRWGLHLGLENVRLLPDGSGHFTRRMGMLVDRDRLGFGYRSWRYAMVVDDGVVAAWFEEPGIDDAGPERDPYGATDPERVIEWLREERAGALGSRTGGTAGPAVGPRPGR